MFKPLKIRGSRSLACSLLFLCLMLGQYSSALAALAEGHQKVLSQYLEAIYTMQAHFLHKVYDVDGKLIQVIGGNMAFQKPNKFYWQAKKRDFNQLIVADGHILWVYDADIAQVIRKPLDKALQENKLSPMFILMHPNSSLQTYFGQVLYSTDHQHRNEYFTLLPKKDSRSLFSQFKLVFKKRELYEVWIKDRFGRLNVITFTHRRFNKKLDQNLFIFQPPKDTDLIDPYAKF